MAGMKRKKILYIESNMDGTIGGSHYSLLYLLEGLNRDRFEPHVLFCQDHILVPRFQKTAEEVLVHDYDPFGANPLNSWKAIPRFVKHIVLKQPELRKIIQRIEPDIVHLNNTYAGNHEWILACLLNNIRIIAHDRGTRPNPTLQTRLFVRFLDAIIPVSDAFANIIIEEGLKPRRLRRVYNGLDTGKFNEYRSPEVRLVLREELGIDRETILVGMVGNIDYWKGQLVFARAMEALMRGAGERISIKGVIVGKTPTYAKTYENEIRDFLKLNNIDDWVWLLGYRYDVPQLLNAMDIFVHASVEPEPFGRVILEAMAMEKPVIATKPGGPCEIIDDGVTGYLVPMNDHLSMRDAILRYIQDPSRAKEMGKAARKAVEMKFPVSRMVRGVEEVYEEILTP